MSERYHIAFDVIKDHWVLDCFAIPKGGDTGGWALLLIQLVLTQISRFRIRPSMRLIPRPRPDAFKPRIGNRNGAVFVSRSQKSGYWSRASSTIFLGSGPIDNLSPPAYLAHRFTCIGAFAPPRPPRNPSDLWADGRSGSPVLVRFRGQNARMNAARAAALASRSLTVQ